MYFCFISSINIITEYLYLRKRPQRKHILKILGSQIKNIQTGVHVDQEIHKADVVFVKSTLNLEI